MFQKTQKKYVVTLMRCKMQKRQIKRTRDTLSFSAKTSTELNKYSKTPI